MRESYGVLFPRFWEGRTGRELQAAGKDAVIVAAYLLSCRHANMIGLYELPLVMLERELPVIQRDALPAALEAVERCRYAAYDVGTEFVWVYEMARIRLGLDRGQLIAANDKKHAAVLRQYAAVADNPFLGPFHDKYRDVLRLGPAREGPARASISRHTEGAQEGLLPEVEGAPKPVQVQVQKQVPVQGSETGTGTGKAAAAPPLELEDDDPFRNVSVITELVKKEIIPEHGLWDEEVFDATKARCSILGIRFTGQVIRRAVDSALAQARRPRVLGAAS